MKVVVLSNYQITTFLCWRISRKDDTPYLNIWYKIFARQTIGSGAFFWKHQPDRFRMKLWVADNNLHIPDTSGSDRVDWWGGCNMMLPRSIATLYKNYLWWKHVS